LLMFLLFLFLEKLILAVNILNISVSPFFRICNACQAKVKKTKGKFAKDNVQRTS
jgi:hypothetical protein